MRGFLEKIFFLPIAFILFAPAANAVRFGMPSDNPAFGGSTAGSATLLCPRLAVTCIHCLRDVSGLGAVILNFPQAINPIIYSDSELKELEVYKHEFLDIAAIGVKNGPGFQFKTPVQFPQLPGQNIAPGSFAEVYGLGLTGLGEKGPVIRTGEVEVSVINDNRIRVVPGRSQQIGCPGDSGGPLIQDNIIYGTLKSGIVRGSHDDEDSDCRATIASDYIKIGERNGVKPWLQGLMDMYCTSETRN